MPREEFPVFHHKCEATCLVWTTTRASRFHVCESSTPSSVRFRTSSNFYFPTMATLHAASSVRGGGNCLVYKSPGSWFRFPAHTNNRPSFRDRWMVALLYHLSFIKQPGCVVAQPEATVVASKTRIPSRSVNWHRTCLGMITRSCVHRLSSASF